MFSVVFWFCLPYTWATFLVTRGHRGTVSYLNKNLPFGGISEASIIAQADQNMRLAQCQVLPQHALIFTLIITDNNNQGIIYLVCFLLYQLANFGGLGSIISRFH